MEWHEILQTRVSCRKYAERPVEHEKVVACVEAARRAPSGHNAQRWRFIVVDDPQKRTLVADALWEQGSFINQFAFDVPVFIAIVKEVPADFTDRTSLVLNEGRIWDIDIGIAAEHMCLEATDQKLGSIIMGRLDEDKVKAALDIPRELEVPLVVGIGYPLSTEVKLRKRRALNEVASHNSYHTPLETI